MKKKTNKYQKMLFIILIGLFVVSLATLLVETDWFFKRPGGVYDTSFDVTKVVYPLTSGGSIVLVRDDTTPLGVEMVSFTNGLDYDYFVVNKDDIVKKEIVINVPTNMLSGTYCYYVHITMSDDFFEERKCFKVK